MSLGVTVVAKLVVMEAKCIPMDPTADMVVHNHNMDRAEKMLTDILTVNIVDKAVSTAVVRTLMYLDMQVVHCRVGLHEKETPPQGWCEVAPVVAVVVGMRKAILVEVVAHGVVVIVIMFLLAVAVAVPVGQVTSAVSHQYRAVLRPQHGRNVPVMGV